MKRHLKLAIGCLAFAVLAFSNANFLNLSTLSKSHA